MRVETKGAITGHRNGFALSGRGLQRYIPTALILLLALALVWASSARADSLAVMTGAGQSGFIGDPGAQPIVVQVRNVDGAPVAGRTIQWSTGNGFQVGAPSSVTDANGNASVSFTYGNYGTTNISAHDTTSGLTAQAPENSVGHDSITLLSGDGQTGQAGTAAAQPIVVQVVDAGGHPVVGRTVNWADTTAYTQVNAATSLTNTSGVASMGFTFLASAPVFSGSSGSITATNSADSRSVTATVTVVGTNVVYITSPSQVSGLVGDTSAPIVAHVADWQGNPIAGATVTWIGDPSIFTLSNASTVTDASGNASITAQYLASTGDDIITADYNGIQDDVHFYLMTKTYMSVLSPQPVIGSPNSPSPTPMVIQDFNKDGTPRVGDTITWTVQSGDAVPNAATSVTDATGTATMGFTFGTLFTQLDAGDTRGVHRGVTVNPSGSGQTVQLVSGAGQFGASLSAATSPIVMKVVDQAGNPQAGVTVNWTQYANGTFGFQGNVVYTSPTTTVSDAAGLVQATFNYGAVGKVAIRAELLSGLGSAATVTSYGTETLFVASGSGQSGLVGTHGAQPVVVEFRDQSGAPLVSQTINWAVEAGGNAILDATSSVTDASGQASMGFTYGATASANGIKASGTSANPFSGPINTEAFVTGVGANSLSIISGNGQSGADGSVGAQPLVVEVRDAAGAVVSGRTINWTSIAGAAAPNAGSSVTDASGHASMGFTYSSLTTSNITATDSVTGQSVVFTLNALNNLNHALVVSGNGQTGLPGSAGAAPIVVQLLDPSNVPVVGDSVAWRVVSGPATLGANTTTTNASGQVQTAFNFGATPGTSIIEAYDPGNPTNGQRVQATVTALGNNQTLSIVSGNGQALPAGTLSSAMVVKLVDFNNVPVVGATIDWSATNGTMTTATSLTDATGQASNTVTTAPSGAPTTVAVSSVRASAAVNFSLSASLAILPGLTPEQEETAIALDNSCTALATQPSLTPEQADLLAQCLALEAAATTDPTATVQALEELISDTAQAQSSASSTAAIAQFQNINARLTALRSSSKTTSLSGLSLAGPGGAIPLGTLMTSLFGDNATETGADFSRWGFFATGTIGRGEADKGRTTPAYHYDINGLTFGLDYRQRDNWIFGAALGYSNQSTDLARNQGDVSMTGWSLAAYSTYSFKERWYLDSVMTYGRNQFDLHRRIRYTLPLPGGGTTSVDQVATGHPDGSLFEAALTFGGDFHKDAWNISPYGQLIYDRLEFDSYAESMQAGPGSGLGLAVNARNVINFSSSIGTRFAYSHSTNWGVLLPTASLEWDHDFKGDPQAITARFINDPTHTPINISGDAADSDYFRISFGLSMVLPHGRSGFLLYEKMLQRDGISQFNLALGMRIEF